MKQPIAGTGGLILQCLLTVVIVLVFSFTTTEEAFSTERKRSSSTVSNLIDQPFYQAVENSHQLAERFLVQLDGFALLPGELANTWHLAAKGRSKGYPFLLLVQICFVLLSAILAELFLRKRLRSVFESITTSHNPGFLSRVSAKGVGIALEALFLLTFVLVTFYLFVLIFPEKGTAAIIASNYLLAAYYIRVLFFLTTVFLAPVRSSLRILPFSDKLAKFLFFWTCTICSVEIVLSRSATILKKTGADESSLLALTGVIIVSSTLMFAIMLNRCRQQVMDALCRSETEERPTSSLVCQFAVHWQLLSFTALLFITAIWEIRVLNTGGVHFGKILVAFLAIPIFLAFDIWGGRLLKTILFKRDSNNDNSGFFEKTGLCNYKIGRASCRERVLRLV